MILYEGDNFVFSEKYKHRIISIPTSKDDILFINIVGQPNNGCTNKFNVLALLTKNHSLVDKFEEWKLGDDIKELENLFDSYYICEGFNKKNVEPKKLYYSMLQLVKVVVKTMKYLEEYSYECGTKKIVL